MIGRLQARPGGSPGIRCMPLFQATTGEGWRPRRRPPHAGVGLPVARLSPVKRQRPSRLFGVFPRA